MLDQQLKDQLQAYMGKIQRPITLTASLDDSQGAQEMRELLNEIASLSDRVSVDDSGTDARKPSFVISPTGQTHGVRFAAIPLGHEFTTLVLALLWTGGHPPKLGQEIIDRIVSLVAGTSFSARCRFMMSTSLCRTCASSAAENLGPSVASTDG